MKYRPSSTITRVESARLISRPQTQNTNMNMNKRGEYKIPVNSRAQTSELRRRTFRVMNLQPESSTVLPRPISNAKTDQGLKNKKEIKLHKLSMGLRNFGSITEDDFKRFDKKEQFTREIDLFEFLGLTTKSKFVVKDISSAFDKRATMFLQKANVQAESLNRREKRNFIKSEITKMKSQQRESSEQSKCLASVPLFHSNENILRVIPGYRKSSSFKGIHKGNLINRHPYLAFDKVCSLMDYPWIETLSDEMSFYVHDSKTAIPYSFFGNKDSGNILIIFHDCFDSWTEYYSELDYENFFYVVFNWPGQAFSVFDSNGDKDAFDFLQVSIVIDSFLGFLEEMDVIDFSEESTISFVGVGFGGLLLKFFCKILCINRSKNDLKRQLFHKESDIH